MEVVASWIWNILLIQIIEDLQLLDIMQDMQVETFLFDLDFEFFFFCFLKFLFLFGKRDECWYQAFGFWKKWKVSNMD